MLHDAKRTHIQRVHTADDWVSRCAIFNPISIGMKEDLDLHNAAYNWAVTMFFIGYVW